MRAAVKTSLASVVCLLSHTSTHEIIHSLTVCFANFANIFTTKKNTFNLKSYAIVFRYLHNSRVYACVHINISVFQCVEILHCIRIFMRNSGNKNH